MCHCGTNWQSRLIQWEHNSIKYITWYQPHRSLHRLKTGRDAKGSYLYLSSDEWVKANGKAEKTEVWDRGSFNLNYQDRGVWIHSKTTTTHPTPPSLISSPRRWELKFSIIWHSISTDFSRSTPSNLSSGQTLSAASSICPLVDLWNCSRVKNTEY